MLPEFGRSAQARFPLKPCRSVRPCDEGWLWSKQERAYGLQAAEDGTASVHLRSFARCRTIRFLLGWTCWLTIFADQRWRGPTALQMVLVNGPCKRSLHRVLAQGPCTRR